MGILEGIILLEILRRESINGGYNSSLIDISTAATISDGEERTLCKDEVASMEWLQCKST